MRLIGRLMHHTVQPASISATIGRSPTQISNLELQSINGTHGLPGRENQHMGTSALEGIAVDFDTYASLLQICADSKALAEGKEVHSHMLKNRFEQKVYLWTKLMTVYAICGCLIHARQVFDKMPTRNLFSWNAMIRGYVMQEQWENALALYYQMQSENIKPDNFTFPFVLKACATLAALQQGMDIHEGVINRGFESNVFVGSALVDMYAKCGKIENARQVFDKLSQRDAGLWTAMIAGYAQRGYRGEALKLFLQMQFAGVKPNSVTIASILPVCGQLGALQQGKELHGYVIREGNELDVFAGSALIDMYAKCGSVESARHVFDKMPQRNVVSWNTMMTGYAMHGYGEEALAAFHQMQQGDTKPDRITYISVLSACSHAGLVDEGRQYFDRMSQDYGITPSVEHYACMVDLLGRAGLLDEAHEFIRKMPLQPNTGVWGALLGACRIHCNLELGEQVAKQLFKLDPENAGYYILLSNIYSAAGRWDDAARLRIKIKGRQMKKEPGCSWIEINNSVHEFLVEEASHPQMKEIYAMLEILAEQMKVAGYIPDTNFVLHDVQ